MKQIALMFVLAAGVGVGCNQVKGADPEPTSVKAPTQPAVAVPAAVPAAIPAAPAAVPAEAVASVPMKAAFEPTAAEPAAAAPKKAAAFSAPKGKAAASDLPPRASKKGRREETSF